MLLPNPSPPVPTYLTAFRKVTSSTAVEDPLRFCQDLLDQASRTDPLLPGDELVALLRAMSREEQDYCVATSYALTMAQAERQRLGVYLTPPPLVEALISAMEEHGLDLGAHRVIDPAAGGAAFVVPLARRMLNLSKNLDGPARLRDLVSRLQGIEIDSGLGRLANRMVRRVLADALDDSVVEASVDKLVREGDALDAPSELLFDAVIGNPPYGRLAAEDYAYWKARCPGLAENGHINWYALFVHKSLGLLKPGGLLGFILPTSFIGSPSYVGFRRSVIEAAEVIRIDHIDQRQGLFDSVQQDCCILVLRKRVGRARRSAPCRLGYVAAGQPYSNVSTFVVPTDGQAWKMACSSTVVRSTEIGRTTSLAELGWRGRVGSIVPHRNGDVLFDDPDVATTRRGQVVVRVLWSKAITSDGRFDADRMDNLDQTYAVCEPDCPSLIKKTSIVVQRTSNKLQRRRINAAVMPRGFIGENGVLAENHVVVLTPPDGTSDEMLPIWADLLSGQDFDNLFKERSGTVTVSIRLLMQLRFPKAWIPDIGEIDKRPSPPPPDNDEPRELGALPGRGSSIELLLAAG